MLKRNARRLLALTPLLLLACGEASPPPPTGPDPAYEAESQAWRSEREENLQREDGWLTLAGLYWLEEGDNRFGSSPDNDLVFPDSAPAQIGAFHLENGQVTVAVEPGAGVTHEGQPVTEMALDAETDDGGQPTVLELGSLSFYAIERAGRLGVRLKDRDSSALASFSGLDYFPIDPAWRIQARFEPYDPPRTIRVPNIIGTEFDESCPGALVFTLEGETFRLEPTGEAGGDLFLVFGDASNGHQTYNGGRFLVVKAPQNGTADLDFNRAYNPPCVFTPYATCPLPPRQNRLPVSVPAGEKMYAGAPEH